MCAWCKDGRCKTDDLWKSFYNIQSHALCSAAQLISRRGLSAQAPTKPSSPDRTRTRDGGSGSDDDDVEESEGDSGGGEGSSKAGDGSNDEASSDSRCAY